VPPCNPQLHRQCRRCECGEWRLPGAGVLALSRWGRAQIPTITTFNTWVQKAKPGFTPDFFTLAGWLSGELFVDALRNAGRDPSRGSLLQSLRKTTSFRGGNLIPVSNPAGKVPITCYLLSQVVNGTFQRLDDPPVSSSTNGEQVASHYPILLDDEAEGLEVLTHVGRPDEMVHGSGDREVLLIILGRNGYISPSWYAPGATRAPTWNFSAAHRYGMPQILEPEENLTVLAGLVAHFECHVEEPMFLDPERGRPVAQCTVGIRLPITRFVCKIKMSQDKDPVTQGQVTAALRRPGPFRNPGLADDMAQALSTD
jgi:transcriptional regulator